MKGLLVLALISGQIVILIQQIHILFKIYSKTASDEDRNYCLISGLVSFVLGLLVMGMLS